MQTAVSKLEAEIAKEVNSCEAAVLDFHAPDAAKTYARELAVVCNRSHALALVRASGVDSSAVLTDYLGGPSDQELFGLLSYGLLLGLRRPAVHWGDEKSLQRATRRSKNWKILESDRSCRPSDVFGVWFRPFHTRGKIKPNVGFRSLQILLDQAALCMASILELAKPPLATGILP